VRIFFFTIFFAYYAAIAPTDRYACNIMILVTYTVDYVLDISPLIA